MKKLKCWKEIDTEMSNDLHTWRTKKGDNKLHLGKEYGEYYVLSVKLTPSYHTKTEYFSDKKNALKFAKSYMKRHDECEI